MEMAKYLLRNFKPRHGIIKNRTRENLPNYYEDENFDSPRDSQFYNISNKIFA